VGKIESCLFQYSLCEQKLPGFFRFNLPQMIRQQYPVNISKTIYSVGVQGGVFKYVAYKKLLELETGFTTNEPVTLAVKQATEKAIYSLVMEGLIDGYWRLADMNLAQPLIDRYAQQRDGTFDVASIQTTIRDHSTGTGVEPPPAREPTGTIPSAEADLQPQIQPGVPAPPPPPTYVLPGQQPPSTSNPLQRSTR